MRTRTFFVSFVVHSLVIGAVIVARLTANDVLPEPPRATSFIMVTPEVPAIPPAPAPRRAQPIAAANPDAAPIVEPLDLLPEVPRVSENIPADSGLVGAGSDLTGLGVLEGPPIQPPPPVRPAPAVPMRVGGDIRPPLKVHHVAPEYPTIARNARVQGVVLLDAVIAEDGTVRTVIVLRSIALLDEAATAAVRQWRFTPALLNGQPVPVIMTVTVAFSLK